jgi:hypothetical protein
MGMGRGVSVWCGVTEHSDGVEPDDGALGQSIVELVGGTDSDTALGWRM